ncbi:MAG: N-acetyltransferase [Planctomycetes bacterium]|nr:N-acetyltransferase [Planctomycetota bacterium]
MKYLLRVAAEQDAAQIQSIYAPVVRDTAISFEIVPPSAEEMAGRMAKISQKYPWLVCEDQGEILGYAYAGPHRERVAYQWSAEVSAYIREGMRRRGIGRTLYAALFRILVLQGYVNAYAGITLPNPASVGLHEAFGFRPVGVYRGIGYKFGAWHDVGWWHFPLQPPPRDPRPPVPFPRIRDSSECGAALGTSQ